MAISRQKKVSILEAFKQQIDGAQSLVASEYKGVTVAQADELRKMCREKGVQYRVLKNNLARLAIKGTAFEPLSAQLTGPIGIASSKEDPAAAARVVVEFAKKVQVFKPRAAVTIDGSLVVGEANVVALSKMPGKNELRAQFLSVLQGPSRNMVTVLSAAQRGFLTVLQRKAEQSAA
ncbi:MAG: 50S ribosomal protein L10 [Myxococcota bacterium]|nr:50S ribosomal protein L10 [Myxococcota bacterium]